MLSLAELDLLLHSYFNNNKQHQQKSKHTTESLLSKVHCCVQNCRNKKKTHQKDAIIKFVSYRFYQNICYYSI